VPPRLRTALGYGWLALAVTAGLAAMLRADFLGAALAGLSGVKVSPRFSGGEAAAVLDHGTYRTIVGRPVSPVQFGERGEGFVQVNWEPAGALPALLREEIDLFSDGGKGFYVTLDTVAGKGTYENPPPCVEGKPKLKRTKSGWAMRIKTMTTREKTKRKGPRETHS